MNKLMEENEKNLNLESLILQIELENERLSSTRTMSPDEPVSSPSEKPAPGKTQEPSSSMDLPLTPIRSTPPTPTPKEAMPIEHLLLVNISSPPHGCLHHARDHLSNLSTKIWKQIQLHSLLALYINFSKQLLFYFGFTFFSSVLQLDFTPFSIFLSIASVHCFFTFTSFFSSSFSDFCFSTTMYLYCI